MFFLDNQAGDNGNTTARFRLMCVPSCCILVAHLKRGDDGDEGAYHMVVANHVTHSDG